MNIYITAATGKARTMLSAFDDALRQMGVYNYNLIPLSSVIPTGANIIEKKRYKTPPEEYGWKLYVVKADVRSRQTGRYIGAGLGWYQNPSDGRGVFVEHTATDDTKSAVESNLTKDITNSVMDICALRNFEMTEKDVKMKITIAKITDAPACAMVLAVYQSESWK